MKVGHLVQILRSEDGKAVGGGDESRKQGSSKWLMDMVMWNLENSLRKDMITVCFLVHSFIHASTPTSFGSNVISISTTTTLVKLSLQPSALLIYLPLPYFFFFFFLAFITFQYTILCSYLLCLILVSPHKTVSQAETLGCFGHHCAPASRTVPSGKHSSVNWANEGTQTSEVSEVPG